MLQLAVSRIIEVCQFLKHGFISYKVDKDSFMKLKQRIQGEKISAFHVSEET